MFRMGEGYFMYMKSFDFEAFAAVLFGRCQICFIKRARRYLKKIDYWKPFRYDEECFLIYLKNSSPSEDI